MQTSEIFCAEFCGLIGVSFCAEATKVRRCTVYADVVLIVTLVVNFITKASRL